MEKVAIIGSGEIAKIIADRAGELNIETHCFSFNPNDIACGSVDHFHEVDIFNTDEITRICAEVGVQGVIATTELTILPAAKVANALGLNGNGLKASEEITNKYLTRSKVKQVAGLHQPAYWLYTGGEEPQVDAYPVIVKPIAAGGKRGIQVVDSADMLSEAIRAALPYSKVKGVLIEEYLAGGTEYSVESLSYQGKTYVVQITQKDTSGPPHCNELGHHQPAEVSEQMRSAVSGVIADMLAAVGIENGPCHTEIKIIDGKIYLIEINARPGGDHITYPLTELSTGYPFVSGILWIAMDRFAGREPEKLERNYCGIYFVTEHTPRLKQVFDRCEEYPWLHTKHQVSDQLSKIVFNDPDNLNYFIYYSKQQRPDIEGEC